ncbi:MAG TPA: hypothetical protein PKD54_02725 [Pirellulaceae bacterium]|nr:hypothetical protein [Pirellulaceae bacterium]
MRSKRAQSGLWLAIGTGLWMLGMVPISSVSAQDIDADKRVLNRTFRGPDDFELVIGQFTGLVDGRAVIVDAQGTAHRFAMAAFHQDDRQWINEQMNQQRKRVESRQEFARIALQLQSNRPATIIQTCRRIRYLNRDANLDKTGLVQVINNFADENVRYEALLAYMAIMPDTGESLDQLLAAFTTHWKGLTPMVERKPEEFLLEIAKLGEIAIPYLAHAIYGGFVTPPATGEAFTDQMQSLADDDVEGWRTREAGIKAAARIRVYDSARLILHALHETEKIEEEALNQRIILVCLNELGNLALDDPDVQQALAFYAPRFPVVVERARKLIAAANTPSDKLP